VKAVLTNKLVSYLFEFDEEALARSRVVDMLEEELRAFLALKAEVQSQKPREPVLESAHEKLLELMQRLFMVAQQALLNRPQADAEDRSQAGQSPDQSPPGAPSGGRQLISWYMRRMNDIGEQFMAALAELADQNRDIYDQLDLPAGIVAEPLRRHERSHEEAEESGESHRPARQRER